MCVCPAAASESREIQQERGAGSGGSSSTSSCCRSNGSLMLQSYRSRRVAARWHKWYTSCSTCICVQKSDGGSRPKEGFVRRRGRQLELASSATAVVHCGRGDAGGGEKCAHVHVWGVCGSSKANGKGKWTAVFLFHSFGCTSAEQAVYPVPLWLLAGCFLYAIGTGLCNRYKSAVAFTPLPLARWAITS